MASPGWIRTCGLYRYRCRSKGLEILLPRPVVSALRNDGASGGQTQLRPTYYPWTLTNARIKSPHPANLRNHNNLRSIDDTVTISRNFCTLICELEASNRYNGTSSA